MTHNNSILIFKTQVVESMTSLLKKPISERKKDASTLLDSYRKKVSMYDYVFFPFHDGILGWSMAILEVSSNVVYCCLSEVQNTMYELDEQ